MMHCVIIDLLFLSRNLKSRLFCKFFVLYADCFCYCMGRFRKPYFFEIMSKQSLHYSEILCLIPNANYDCLIHNSWLFSNQLLYEAKYLFERWLMTSCPSEVYFGASFNFHCILKNQEWISILSHNR